PVASRWICAPSVRAPTFSRSTRISGTFSPALHPCSPRLPWLFRRTSFTCQSLCKRLRRFDETYLDLSLASVLRFHTAGAREKRHHGQRSHRAHQEKSWYALEKRNRRYVQVRRSECQSHRHRHNDDDHARRSAVRRGK